MKTKKLLSIILSLVITISSLSFGAVSASAAEITPKEPDKIGEVYQIGTKEELYWFAGLVNGTLTDGTAQNKGASAVLTADITVNDSLLSSLEFDASGNLTNGDNFIGWTPIGKIVIDDESGSIIEDFCYYGTFDGQNHTISGLYFNNTSASTVGLFGHLGLGGEIKNVGVIDSYFKGEYFIGGVCGQNDGTITDCYNTGTVSGSNFVSGVCGKNQYYGTITGCYNTGAVSGNDTIGGVCGYNENGTITGCYNTGTVSGDNEVGGVCGANNSTITGCYNIGTVSGSDEIGGVCGSNSTLCIIIGCYNTGKVSGSGNHVGGVCGNNDGNATITGCYNTGTVSSTNNYIGGVCGYNEFGTITGCYTNSSGVYGENNNGTVTASAEYTGNEFKDGTVCVLLNNAIGNLYDVTFYQGEEIPLFFSKTENRSCTVNYAVASTYTVTIPETVTLGQTATIKAENVVVDEDKQLEVKLTGTSETDNAFKVTSAEGAELEYKVNNGTKDISINESILTVNPDNSDSGTAALSFNAPNASDITYAGKYTGTVTFTVSVERG